MNSDDENEHIIITVLGLKGSEVDVTHECGMLVLDTLLRFLNSN